MVPAAVETPPVVTDPEPAVVPETPPIVPETPPVVPENPPVVPEPEPEAEPEPPPALDLEIRCDLSIKAGNRKIYAGPWSLTIPGGAEPEELFTSQESMINFLEGALRHARVAYNNYLIKHEPRKKKPKSEPMEMMGLPPVNQEIFDGVLEPEVVNTPPPNLGDLVRQNQASEPPEVVP